MTGRKFSAGVGYRYGFNGKENENDVKGEGAQYDYGFRIYDPRLGKFLSVDPLTKEFPHYTPYQFAGNTPIQAIDLDGLEELHYTLKKEHGYYCIEFTYQSNTFDLDTKPFKAGNKIPEGEKYFILHFQDPYWGDMTWEFSSPNEMFKKGIKGPNALGFHREGKREAIQNMVNSSAMAMVPMPAMSPSYHRLKGKSQGAIKGETAGNNIAKANINSNSTTTNSSSEQRIILYHYTNAEGQEGILRSQTLKPSLKALNPNDARYGDGQYLSDITPGSKNPAQLSRSFLNIPYLGKRFTHYIAIDVTDLNVTRGRDGVFVIPNSNDLNLQGRIIGSGQVQSQQKTSSSNK